MERQTSQNHLGVEEKNSWHFRKGADSEKKASVHKDAQMGVFFSSASFHLLRTGI